MKVDIGHGGWGVDAPTFTLRPESKTDEAMLSAFCRAYYARRNGKLLGGSTYAEGGYVSATIAVAPMSKDELLLRQVRELIDRTRNQASLTKYYIRRVWRAVRNWRPEE